MGKIKSNEDVEKYKADLNAELQLTLAKLSAGKTIDLETLKARLKNGTPDSEIKGVFAEISKALQEIRDNEAAPIKIVRKNGKIVGRERNGVFTALEDA